VVDHPKVLFICGSLNQTTQMHQIARELPEVRPSFTPFYVDGWLDVMHRLGAAEFTVAGGKLRRRCLDYLERNGLLVDPRGERGPYDLVVTCSDLVVQRNLRGRCVELAAGRPLIFAPPEREGGSGPAGDRGRGPVRPRLHVAAAEALEVDQVPRSHGPRADEEQGPEGGGGRTGSRSRRSRPSFDDPGRGRHTASSSRGRVSRRRRA